MMAEVAPALLELAVEYARRGWRVFPLAGKIPAERGGRGCLDATTDESVVRQWWECHPHANVGIATGEASGLLAVDLDGPDARRAWLSLVGRHDPIETPTSRTGRADGGLHVLFRWPAGEHVPNRSQGEWSARVLGDRKIEVIGEGRYIVAPGSLHASGARYAWEHGSGERELAALPEWLVSLLREELPAARAEAPTWVPRTERDASRARAFCLGALRSGHDAVAGLPRGQRNAGLVREAYALGGYVPTGFLEAHEVRTALRSACAHWPADERDLRKDIATIERGLYAGVSMPRSIPDPRPFEHASAGSIAAPVEALTPADIVPLSAVPLVRKWKTAAELAMELEALGPGLPTGFRTLDEWTRGGLRQGKLVVVAGAPGAGKTLFATQLAHGYHDLGHPVAIYAVDESREGVMVRWGQQCGLVREDLEEAHPHTRQALAGCFASGLVDFIDPDEATLNEVGAWLIERSKGLEMPGVLVVDSLQTCRIAGGEALDARQRIDAVVDLLKSLRNAGLLVIATSEVGRGWYRGGDKVDPLAAFKESGSIEYALDAGVVLESVKDEVGHVDVWVPKSRLGRADRSEPACRARIDFARASMSQIERPDTDGDGESYVSSLDPGAVETVAYEILHALISARGEVRTRKDLERIVPRGQRLTSHAVSLLLKDGRITGGKGKPYSVAPNRDVLESRT